MIPLSLIEVDLKVIESLAKNEAGNNPLTEALLAAKEKVDPVFVKRGSSILVMERLQFEEIKLAIGGK